VADGRYPAGWNEAAWDGRDASGRAVGGGVYVALIRAEDFRKALKFIVVR
jgi:hypothetical protein